MNKNCESEQYSNCRIKNSKTYHVQLISDNKLAIPGPFILSLQDFLMILQDFNVLDWRISIMIIAGIMPCIGHCGHDWAHYTQIVKVAHTRRTLLLEWAHATDRIIGFVRNGYWAEAVFAHDIIAFGRLWLMPAAVYFLY